MIGPAVDPHDARLLVEARLGRPPQDMLEAAVVLEAWAGVPAQAALGAAGATMPAEPALPQPSAGRLPRAEGTGGVMADGIAFMICVIAIACWAAPLTRDVGVRVVEHALVLALPLTLALQRVLGSRFLDRPDGVAQLAARTRLLSVAALAILLVPTLTLGPSGALAALLTITWTGGTVLIRRHWPAAYVLIVLVATAAMLAGAPAREVVTAAAAATALVVAAALRTTPRAARRLAGGGRGQPAALAAAIGVGLGAMLVLDRAVSWTEGAVPALALLPSALAALLAGWHLRHLERAIPQALSRVPVGTLPARRGRGGPTRVLWGAVWRMACISVLLSAAVVAAGPWLGEIAHGAAVLAGFALIALASMLVGLLEALGRGAWALAAVAAGVAGETAVRLADAAPFAGAGLVLGGGVVTLLVLPFVVTLLRRPATTLATALWIP